MGADGEKHRPIMIHRVVFGSIERFIGILTEHFAGAFPTWLAPVQVKLLPIADRHIDYLNTVKAKLEAAGIRCEVDDRSEKIGFKIRSAQMEKVPYMLVAWRTLSPALPRRLPLRQNKKRQSKRPVQLVQGVFCDFVE